MSESNTNADPEELRKFERFAAHWWEPGGEMKAIHQINPLRLRFIDARVALAGKTVLDVGCGGGILSEAMALAGATVTGIDLAGEALAAARQHAMTSGVAIDYREIAAETLSAERPGSFDVVTCMEMLEHVPDPAAIVRACAQLVRPGGSVFFSSINRTPRAWLIAIMAAEYLLRVVPRGTHEYAKFVRPSEVDQWAREAGLDTHEITGLHYDPLLGQHRLGAGVDVNYIIYCRRG